MKNNNFEDFSRKKGNKKFSEKKKKFQDIDNDVVFKNKAKKQYKRNKMDLIEEDSLAELEDYQ